MSDLVLDIPAERRARLEAIAQGRGVSLSALLEEMSERALAEYEAEERFRQRAAKGDAAKGLAILDRVEEAQET